MSYRRLWLLVATALLLCRPLPGLAADPLASLTVVVESGGKRLSGLERYVAVVRETEPWSHPLAEKIVGEAEDRPTFSLLSGRYRVMCAAEGYWWSFSDVLELSPGDSLVFSCSVETVAPVVGRVFDATSGGPLEGARVGHVHTFLSNYSLAPSEIGSDFATRHHSSSTDAQGSFEVMGPRGGRAPLWVEASGFAPTMIPLAHFGEPALPIRIELQRGARLTARFDAPSESRPDSLIVLVIPKGDIGALASRDLAPAARGMWRRTLAEAPLTWTLPPGDYDLLVYGTLVQRNVSSPLLQRSISLAPGELRTIELQIEEPSLSLRSTAPDLELLLDSRVRPEELLVDQILANGRLETPPYQVSQVSGGSLVKLQAGCREDSVVVVTAPNQISEPVFVGPGNCETPLRPSMLSAGRISGTLQLPPGYRPDEIVIVRVMPCSQPTSQRARGNLDYLARPQGLTFARALPEGCHDLEVQTGPFVSQVISAISVESGKQTSLGAIALHRSGGTAAQVMDSTGRPLPRADTFLLHEEGFEDEVRRILSGDDPETRFAGVTDQQGWVVFDGVSPGKHHLAARAPGYSTSFSESFQISPGSEAVVELEMPIAAGLRVEVTIPDEIFQTFEALEFDAKAVGEEHWARAANVVKTTATVPWTTFEDLPPAVWNVTAMGRRVSGRREILGERVAELHEGERLSVEIPMATRPIRGSVSQRGEPVAAELVFRPTVRADGPSFQFRTSAGDDGLFDLFMTPGSYEVTARVGDHPHPVELGRVEPHPDEALELEIPEGGVLGIVSDEHGDPVIAAVVEAELIEAVANTGSASAGLASATARSDEAGNFELVGMLSGRWSLRASSAGLESEPQFVTVDPARTPSQVRLVLEETRTLPGTILSSSGAPLRGAVVRVSGLAASGAPSTALLRTDDSGHIELPSWVREGQVVNVEIAAASGDVGALTLQVEGSPVIHSAADYGVLELEAPERLWGSVPVGVWMLVGGAGQSISLGTLAAAGLVNRDGNVLRVERIPVGDWRLVKIDSPLALETLLAGRALDIATFQVGVGEQKRVVVNPRR